MPDQLCDEDRRAVDFIFDRAHGVTTDEDSRLYVAPGDVSPERINIVERFLSMLQAMPVPDSNNNLVDRTLRFIEQRAIRGDEGAAAEIHAQP
jgi:hypothetical protein